MLFAMLSSCAKQPRHEAGSPVPLRLALNFPENQQRLALSYTDENTRIVSLPASQFESPEVLLDGADQRFRHKRVFRWLSYTIKNQAAVLRTGSIPIEDRNRMSLDAVELEAKVNDRLQLDFSFMQVDFMSEADADAFCSKGAPGFVRTWRASQTHTVTEAGEIPLAFSQTGKSIVQMGILRVPADSGEAEKLSQLQATLYDRTTGLTLEQKICQLERPLGSEHETNAVYLRAPVFALPLDSLQFVYTRNDLKIQTVTAEARPETLSGSASGWETLAELQVRSAFNVEKKGSEWFLQRDTLGAVLPRSFFPRLPFGLADDDTAAQRKKVEVSNTLSSLKNNKSENVLVELIDGNDTQCGSANAFFSKVGSAQTTELPLYLKRGAEKYRLRIRTISPQGIVTCSTNTLDYEHPGLKPDAGESKIAVGRGHTCAIQGGKLFCWGANNRGQLGDGSFTDKSAPTAVSNLGNGVLAVAASNDFTCAIVNESDTQPRVLKCWGDNSGNRFGVPSPASPPAPEAVPRTILVDSGMNRTVKLVAAGEVTCSIQSNSEASTSGTLYCWYNSNKSSLASVSFPSQVSHVNISKMISTNLICARGTAAAGGTTTTACVAYSDTGSHTASNEITSLQSTIQNSLVSATSLNFASGENHVCTLDGNKVRCAGKNNFGQFGDVLIATSDSWIFSLNTGIGDFSKVAAFGNNTCGITTAGELKCWGKNDRSQLGFYSQDVKTNPTTVPGMERDVTALVTGEGHACAVQNGLLKCWGKNDNGQLGRRGASRELEYVSAPAGSSISGSGIEALAVGGILSGATDEMQRKGHTCAIQSGRLMCWGHNDFGQLGLGSEGSNPRMPQSPLNLEGKVTAVATGQAHTCAVAGANAELRCWGRNDFGQLGTSNSVGGITTTKPSSLVTRLINVSAVAAGESHTCAISSGDLYCWGKNDQSQIGSPAGNQSPTPNKVTGLPQLVSVATRKGHTCTLDREGHINCFGSDSHGQRGDGSITNEAGFTQIAVGNTHSCAIQGGQMLCWGSNEYGQLGQDSATCRSSARMVVPGFEDGVTSIATGEDHTCAIKNGALWCWGRNDYGQLGLGKTTLPATTPAPTPNPTPTPTSPGQIGAGVNATQTDSQESVSGSCPSNNAGVNQPTQIIESGVTHVSAGSGTCAVLYGRELKCWGTRFNGKSENSPSPAGVIAP